MQRYFIRKEQIDFDKKIATIVGDDVHHIKNVMRMKVDDLVYLCDNDKAYIAKIKSILDIVTLEIIGIDEKEVELPVNVTIAHGLVSREKKEDTIQKITQLGAVGYIPVIMKRSVVKYIKEKENKQLLRLQKIAKEASEQSHRNKELIVSNTLTFKELLKVSNNYDTLLYAHTSSDIENTSLAHVLQNKNIKNILILIGPEAGIDESEVRELKDWKAVNLGPRILRTEVAPLYIMSAISYALEIEE